jgi:hypothetical protein
MVNFSRVKYERIDIALAVTSVFVLESYESEERNVDEFV